MKVAIRVDANEKVATGHVMRCLAIAEELKRLGKSPLFISADNFPKTLIEQYGYKFVSLQSDWRYLEKETKRLQKVIEQYDIGVILVDSYYVTKLYLEKIHALTKVIYIDDLGKDVYDVDAVVCYANYYKDLSLEKRYSSKVMLLLGTRYTPLRNAFSNLPSKEISLQMSKLLVLSGGTDPYDFMNNFSEKIVESDLYETLEEINIICGRYYNKYDELKEKFVGSPKLQCHKAVNTIEKYMLSADVAITAAGVTSYELCAVGVPTITYMMADNQQKNAKSFHADGIMECVGDLRCDPVLKRIMELLDGKYREYSYRNKVSEIMRKKVDGKGAGRIAKEIYRLMHN